MVMERFAALLWILLVLPSCTDPLASDLETGEYADEQELPVSDYIQPHPANPSYWQYRGEPIVLIGGSDHTPVFNFRQPTVHLASSTEKGDRGPDTMEGHLERLAAHGGNYIRNTLSWYLPHAGHVKPFRRTADGLFDLSDENPEFWSRFEHFLQEAYRQDIIVQLELFDPFNYHQDRANERGWSVNPFNPALNRNYTAEATGLPNSVDRRTRQFAHPIFQTAPGMAYHRDGVVIGYLESFVGRMLEVSLRYPNVLYTIYNEGHEDYQPKQFADHWSAFIRERAAELKANVFVGLMPFEGDPTHPTYRAVYDDPGNYQFVDMSQNNRLYGEGEEVHWRHIMQAREQVAAARRPLTSVKVYGFGVRDESSRDYNPAHSWTGGTMDAVDRHFRNLLGGLSTSRFHRPPAGLGLSVQGEIVLRSSRMLLDAIDLVSCDPDADFSLFYSRNENQAYACSTGSDFAVYVAGPGSFGLHLPAGSYELRWIDVMEARWTDTELVASASLATPVFFDPPGPGHLGVILRR